MMPAPPGKAVRYEERRAQVEALLEAEPTLTYRHVAERLGISQSRVVHVMMSRTAYERHKAASREAKRRRTGRCRVCGGPTRYNGKHGKGASEVCHSCNARAQAAANIVWTRERIVAALHDAHQALGRPPGMVDFNPNLARAKGNLVRAELSERMIAAGRWPWSSAGRWPWSSAIYLRFGSYNAAMAAAGFAPRPPHGTRESRAGACKPRPAGREAPSPRKEQRS